MTATDTDNRRDVAAEGRLDATTNADKQPGDKRPDFKGTLQLSGETDDRELALWVHANANGTVLSGEAPPSVLDAILDVVHDQNQAEPSEPDDNPPVKLKPYAVVLFQRKRAWRKGKKPDYFGYYHPGPRQPILSLSVWAKRDSDGKPTLRGTLSPYQSKTNRVQADDNEAAVAETDR